MDFDCESDNTDDIYEVERILEAKKKVSWSCLCRELFGILYNAIKYLSVMHT